jgi:hypothetical protein
MGLIGSRHGVEAEPRSKRLAGRRQVVVVGAVVFYVVATLVARRRGYNFGGNVVVRCREGHLFTTIWIPGASLKALRLGWFRVQRCPVGEHWSLVRPVREADLSEEDRQFAADHHDIRLP